MPTQPYRNAKGERVPGVTTVISGNLGWNTRQLMHWAWTEGVEGRDYRDTSKRAADAGTLAHAMIEAELKRRDWRELVDVRGVAEETLSQARTAYGAWREWADLVQFRVLHSELSLVSERHQYGGTIDIALVKRTTAICDLKTSGGVYPDHLIQLSAYGQLWNEHHPDDPIRAYYLLRVDKHTGGFAYHYWPQLDAAWEAFQALLVLHRLKKRIA